VIAIDTDFLSRLVPRQSGARGERQSAIIQGLSVAASAVLPRYEIDSPLRIVHFLAQIAHESDALCTTEEYASGLAYEMRHDLGNDRPGDGRRYKGRGLIQLTGKATYENTGARLGEDLLTAPERVNDAPLYLLVSCDFWQSRRINPHCDADDLVAVTQLVNGGQNGLASRRAYLAQARALVAERLALVVKPAGAGLPVLHRGAVSDAVAILQRRLSVAGYPLPLDGDFGPGTDLAVKHFQTAQGLQCDGIVGAATWTRLG
jgi:putative chitinase